MWKIKCFEGTQLFRFPQRFPAVLLSKIDHFFRSNAARPQKGGATKKWILMERDLQPGNRKLYLKLNDVQPQERRLMKLRNFWENFISIKSRMRTFFPWKSYFIINDQLRFQDFYYWSLLLIFSLDSNFCGQAYLTLVWSGQPHLKLIFLSSSGRD